jgi:hypothetical protein
MDRRARRYFSLFNNLCRGLRQRKLPRHGIPRRHAATHRHAFGNFDDHNHAIGSLFVRTAIAIAVDSAQADRQMTLPARILASFRDAASGVHFTFRLTFFNRLVY